MNPINQTAPAAPVKNNSPVAEQPKVGSLILSSGKIKAVEHLLAFYFCKEGGTEYMQSHKAARYGVRALTWLATPAIPLMLAIAAIIDAKDNHTAKIKNAVILNAQNDVFKAYGNDKVFGEYLLPKYRPISEIKTVKDGQARQKLDFKIDDINAAVNKLVDTVIAKVGNTPFAEALETYKDAVALFEKTATEEASTNRPFRNTPVVQNDMKPRLITAYYNALIANLGANFVARLPSMPSIEEIDQYAKDLHNFAKGTVSTSVEGVRDAILASMKDALVDAESAETIGKMQEQLFDDKDRIVNDPAHPLVKAAVSEYLKGIDSRIEKNAAKINDINVKKEGYKKELEESRVQLEEMNNQFLQFFAGARKLDKKQFNSAKNAPQSDVANTVVDKLLSDETVAGFEKLETVRKDRQALLEKHAQLAKAIKGIYDEYTVLEKEMRKLEQDKQDASSNTSYSEKFMDIKMPFIKQADEKLAVLGNILNTHAKCDDVAKQIEIDAETASVQSGNDSDVDSITLEHPLKRKVVAADFRNMEAFATTFGFGFGR